MIIELGNHSPHPREIDGRPKVTTIHVPEFDEQGLGGYTHEAGLDVAEFKKHLQDAVLYRGGITNLPEHEIPLVVAQAWPTQAGDKPAWVSVRSHEQLTGEAIGHPPEVAADLECFLREYFELPDSAEKPLDVEDRYWTRFGPPGVGGPTLPPLTAVFTNAGRVISNVNDGGVP